MAIKRNVLAESGATVQAEDGNVTYATIQMRHGKEADIDKSKFVPAEMGVATDTRKVFMGFAPNDVEEMALKKDIPDGTMDYGDLENKPSIGGIELQGNKTLEQLGIQPKGNYLTKVPDEYVTDNEMKTELAKKLDKNQGTENAGKVLAVGKDGNVIHGGNLESLAIKLTASGDSPLSIRDSSEWKVQNFAMQGKTEQVVTTGAQLLKPPKKLNETLSNITWKYIKGYVIADGSTPVDSTSNYYIVGSSTEYENIGLVAGAYTLSGNIPPGTEFIIKANSGEQYTINNSVTQIDFTIKNEETYRMFYRVKENTSVANAILKVMLNSGSESLPWEPYTGGQPSPSPDYPQEIVNAGKHNEGTQKWEYEVNVGGANLANIPSAISPSGKKPSGLSDSGFTIINSETDSEFRIIYVYVPKKLEKGKPYVISIQADSRVYIYLPNIDQYGIQYNKPFYPKDTVNKIGMYVDKSEYGEFKVENIMLNEGSEPYPFEPYRAPQTLTLQSDRPLTKWDRLEKRDGQWGWVYKSNVTTVKIERIVNLTNGNKGGAFNPEDKIKVDSTGSFVKNATNNYSYKNGSYYENKNNFVFVGTNTDSLETLKEKYEGQEIIYLTADENFVPLTESEQTALEALTTYFPTTIISNDADCEMEIEYVADTKTYIDNKFAELAQNLAATQNTLLEV